MPLLSVVAGVAAILVVLIAAFSVRRFRAAAADEPGETGADHAGGMLSALFLLVLAIAIIVPWTNADSARQNTYTEARSLTDAYWAAGGLPDPAKQQARGAIDGYLRYAAGPEWQTLRHGRLTDAGWRRLDTLRATLDGLDLKNGDQSDARDDAVAAVKDASSAREQRSEDAKAGLPGGVVWLTVLSGFVIVVFPFLAGVRARGRALIPVIVMAALLGVTVFLTIDIAHPFSGGLAVGPGAYRTALHELPRIRTAVP
jgi:protein-S-isoprenylcysteine O-methyltransferase Ste14